MNISDTPETDEKFNPQKGWTGVCDIDHARDLERRLAAMTLTAKHEEESKEYNAGLCYDLKRRLAVARVALEKSRATMSMWESGFSECLELIDEALTIIDMP